MEPTNTEKALNEVQVETVDYGRGFKSIYRGRTFLTQSRFGDNCEIFEIDPDTGEAISPAFPFSMRQFDTMLVKEMSVRTAVLNLVKKLVEQSQAAPAKPTTVSDQIITALPESGEISLDFGVALIALKEGKKIYRTNWNNNRFRVQLGETEFILGDGAKYEVQVPLMLNAEGEICGTWHPSPTDILAMDWHFE